MAPRPASRTQADSGSEAKAIGAVGRAIAGSKPRRVRNGGCDDMGKAEAGAAGKMLDILSGFDHRFPSGTAREIAQRTNISESTLFRLLRRLHQRGYLWHDAVSRRYGPGLKLIQLGDVVLRELHIPDAVKVILDDLQTASAENANFNIWRGGTHRTCIAVSHSALALREFIGVGGTHGLWLGASGKAIAAFLSPTLQMRIAEKADDTTKGREAFLHSLAEVQDSGISITAGERVEGVMALSAPVFDGAEIIGSLTVSGPAFRIESKAKKIRPLVIQKAKELSLSFAEQHEREI